MAKIRIGGFCWLLLIVVAAILALPIVADGAYGERTAAAPAPRSGTPVTAPMVSSASDDTESTSDDTESASDHCPVRRCGRTTVEPARSGPLMSTTEQAWTDSGPGITAPLTQREAVPLSKSGELPVQHGVFRC
ncbi:hypothetical protein SSP35_65_00020 [Streptomyces sp. NBRC 110611]|uniref:hypothetical protein n=1 Tax=Streptomyces sp. NBRC 110611 TaxID=1621259 RepID=UPI000833F6AA|nr:hypothetical protein [Streptomyces sp. NBRC 110611]GAU71641.1 hypothetical protein SSP35_65_00020 [Streptomyces sp. NBRC 110611]